MIRPVVGKFLAVVAMVGLSCSSATAAIIFNNGNPQTAPIPAQGAPFADAGNTSFTQALDNFTLPAGQNTIRDLHWWGIYGSGIANPPVDQFAINIYNDNAGGPGTLNTAVGLINVVRTKTMQTITGFTMYSYDAIVSPSITLTAGTNYWLGISNGSGGNSWAWVQSANSGGNARQWSSASGVYTATNKGLAFNITDTIVPEPSSVVLLAAGAMLVGGGQWVRRRRAQS